MKRYHTIRFKNTIIITITMIIVCLMAFIVSRSLMVSFQREMNASRLNSDITILSDYLSPGYWSLNEDGYLLKGDVVLGNGTPEAANIDSFIKFEEDTGTFCYVFKIDDQKELEHINGYDTNVLDYDEGHFLRVAGSTLDPNGKSIVGTYMTKNVSDILDQSGYYEGDANVAGGMIYCVYKTLTDSEGAVIGAIVVGRSISAIHHDINTKTISLLVILAVICVIALFVQTAISRTMVHNIEKATAYVQRIDYEHMPEDVLEIDTKDELNMLAQGINSMTVKLRETERLRRRAETDPLTNIPNRLGFQKHVSQIFSGSSEDMAAISMIDIDYFKQFNDNYGHQAGD